MPIGILGQKKYMTRVFLESGEMVPVTVISCPKNVIDQIKTTDKDGYEAVKLAAFPRKHQTKTKTHYFSKEIRAQHTDGVEKGSDVSLADFVDVKEVKVIGTSKGKGFQGVIKRHGFSGGPGGHGSKFHRMPGSMGTRKPSRTVKGKKMPGRMGGDKITLQTVQVVKVDVQQELIALKGAIPGAKNSFVTLIAK